MRDLRLVALAVLAMAPGAMAQRMIAVDSGRVLYEVDITNGVKTQIGNVTVNAGTTGGLCYDQANDIVYLTSTSLDSLFTLDIDTGEATLVGPYGDSAIVMHGLEYDPATGILYGLSSHNNGLYNINKTNGFATLIGTSGLSSFSNLGLDTDRDIMWSTNSGADSFYEMHRGDGSVRLVGPLVNSTNPNALAYRPDDQTLYMCDNSTDNFYWIDTDTGEAHIIGSMGTGNVLGLVWIPAPHTGPSLALGGECPGQVEVLWVDATPQRPMGIVFASNTGSYEIPGGPCGGTTLGLGSQNFRLVRIVNTGPGFGNVSGNAGPSACNGYLQLVVLDGDPCAISNVVHLP